jgi:sterol desaturase/sphingolipid hydroxylase (fatty acid hydroxylase superfamily)
MDWIGDENIRLAILFGGMFVLCGVEFVVPLRKAERRHIISNFLLTLSLIFINLLCSGAIVYLGVWADSNNFGLLRLMDVSMTVQIVVGIVALDFWAAYVSHVLFHKVPWLWRFHSIHHSDKMVDVSTAFRQHPVESVFRIVFYASGMVLLGIPLWILLLYLTLSGINAQLEHANVHVPASLDKLLQYFYVTPNMHKVHHSKFQPETDSNYSNILSIWDRLFGTYRTRREYQNVPYGLDYIGEKQKLSFLELLKLPFQKRSHQDEP